MSKQKTIGFGVISASGMAVAHMSAIHQNSDARLIAVCDLDREKATQVAGRFAILHVYTDYRELLKCREVDAVVICTPDQLHREMTLAALSAGKHVLCEKPMALTLADCQAMIAAGEQSPQKLMIGQICRFTPGFLLAKKLIDRGEIGELFYVESEYAHDYSKIIGPNHWRGDPLRHPFLGGGCHAVDLLRWIAGNPSEVTAYANRKIFRDLPTDDCTIAIFKFPNDVIGKVFVSIGCKRGYTMRSVFYGSRGTIIADNTTPSLTVYKDDVAPKDSLFDDIKRHETPILVPVSLNNHNTAGEINVFTEAILLDRPIAMNAVEGAATVAACLAAVDSAAKGWPVKISYPLTGGTNTCA
jgi:UDP-N-acetylglucosamine 3-dehydrogenase